MAWLQSSFIPILAYRIAAWASEWAPFLGNPVASDAVDSRRVLESPGGE